MYERVAHASNAYLHTLFEKSCANFEIYDPIERNQSFEVVFIKRSNQNVNSSGPRLCVGCFTFHVYMQIAINLKSRPMVSTQKKNSQQTTIGKQVI